MASVVVIGTDPQLRSGVVDACRAAGVAVFTVGSIPEIERWPTGGIVITDLAHLTPWWKTVGATHVIAMVDDVAAGIEALQRGATGWLVREDSYSFVATMALNISSRRRGRGRA
jgi:hypothetical protein